MKKMHKFLSIILALTMALSLAIPAFAAETEGPTDPNEVIDTDSDSSYETPENSAEEKLGKIEIDNTKKDQEYALYQIFELKSFNQTTKTYSYSVPEAWKAFVNDSTKGGKYVKITNGYVEWINEKSDAATAQEFAALALEYATTNKINPIETLKANNDGEVLVFDGADGKGIPLGYYLVDSSLGALCNLTSTDFNVKIHEKNDKPGVEKNILEDGTKTANDGKIGQTVNYEAKITVQSGAENYVFHDKMSAGLTPNADVVVKIDDNVVNPGEDTFTVTYGDNKETNDTIEKLTDGCAFEIAFDDAYLADKAGKVIVITYSAVINEDAVVAGDGNENDASLKYGDDNESAHDYTRTYTWEIPVAKVDKDKKPLAGAEFQLRTAADDASTALTFTYDEVAKKYKFDSESTINTITTSTTDGSNGRFVMSGLDSGTYYLVETKAPAGYTELEKPIEITITATQGADDPTTGKPTMSATIQIKRDATDAEEADASNNVVDGIITIDVTGDIEVVNLSGVELPETGGIGTTIFYVAGSIMVLGAVILLVTKKKMTNR